MKKRNQNINQILILRLASINQIYKMKNQKVNDSNKPQRRDDINPEEVPAMVILKITMVKNQLKKNHQEPVFN